MKKLLTLLVLAAFTALATDIIPTPGNIGSVGNPTNIFATVYATNHFGAFTGNGSGLTNLAGAMQPYLTNVTLTAATSLQIYFTAFPDLTTNYIVTAPNDLMGATTTAKASNNFTLSFTTVTLTSQNLEGAVVHR